MDVLERALDLFDESWILGHWSPVTEKESTDIFDRRLSLRYQRMPIEHDENLPAELAEISAGFPMHYTFAETGTFVTTLCRAQWLSIVRKPGPGSSP